MGADAGRPLPTTPQSRAASLLVSSLALLKKPVQLTICFGCSLRDILNPFPPGAVRGQLQNPGVLLHPVRPSQSWSALTEGTRLEWLPSHSSTMVVDLLARLCVRFAVVGNWGIDWRSLSYRYRALALVGGRSGQLQRSCFTATIVDGAFWGVHSFCHPQMCGRYRLPTLHLSGTAPSAQGCLHTGRAGSRWRCFTFSACIA